MSDGIPLSRAPAAEPAAAPRLDRKTILRITLAVLAVRACLLAWAFLVHPADQARNETLLQIWKRWDGQHYLEIAKYGYSGEGMSAETKEFNSRFPPLYPCLVRVATAVLPFVDYVAGILVSVACLVGASLVLFRLLLYETQDRRAAWWSVCFLNIHPGSYFGHSVYAESLFVFLGLVYLFQVRIGRSAWLESLSLGGLILTRSAGLAFLLLHGIQTAKRLREDFRCNKQRIKRLLVHIAISLIPLLAYGGFLLFQRALDLPGYSGKNVPFSWNKYPFQESVDAFNRFMSWREAWADENFLYTIGYSHLILCACSLLVLIGCFLLPYEYSLAGGGYILLLSLMNWNIASIRYTFCLVTLPVILVRLLPEYGRWIAAATSIALLTYFTRIFIVKWLLM